MEARVINPSFWKAPYHVVPHLYIFHALKKLALVRSPKHQPCLQILDPQDYKEYMVLDAQELKVSISLSIVVVVLTMLIQYFLSMTKPKILSFTIHLVDKIFFICLSSILNHYKKLKL